ncbi:hypothetical protein C923_00267 [Plasmodium falciparum UGT5.1]|uniref:Uncharacterized protein n=1 Tax=Plasmodium falciparum UGT5.1 TaxID=1237627 RepID=W7JVD4_PLAFA|nr:hypothetical protein C923_00267 [Plasmodium falciparum UGT5.1]
MYICTLQNLKKIKSYLKRNINIMSSQYQLFMCIFDIYYKKIAFHKKINKRIRKKSSRKREGYNFQR